MRLGRLEVFNYKQTSETGFVLALRAYRYGVLNTAVRQRYGSGFVLSIVILDRHFCFDVKLTLPALRETRSTGKAAI
jgi:hypothetical protein